MLKFLRKKKATLTVGVQLAANYVSLLVLDCKDSKQPVIRDYVNYPIDENVSVEDLHERIRTYIEEQGLKGSSCCLVLDDEDYQLLVVEPPKVPREELAEAIKWKIKDLISFPVGDAVVDVFLQADANLSEKNIANAIVVHKNIIEKKSDFIQMIGLELVAIDIPEFSYRNYFEKTDFNEKSIALVVIKPSSGKLVVIQKGEVLFSRGFQIHYRGGLFDDIPESEVVLELQRSLDYYERQLKQIMPTTAIFIGENIVEDKITEETRSSLNQEVFVESVSGFEFLEEDGLATARLIATYGASLRENLLAGNVA